MVTWLCSHTGGPVPCEAMVARYYGGWMRWVPCNNPPMGDLPCPCSSSSSPFSAPSDFSDSAVANKMPSSGTLGASPQWHGRRCVTWQKPRETYGCHTCSNCIWVLYMYPQMYIHTYSVDQLFTVWSFEFMTAKQQDSTQKVTPLIKNDVSLTPWASHGAAHDGSFAMTRIPLTTGAGFQNRWWSLVYGLVAAILVTLRTGYHAFSFLPWVHLTWIAVGKIWILLYVFLLNFWIPFVNLYLKFCFSCIHFLFILIGGKIRHDFSSNSRVISLIHLSASSFLRR